MLVIVKKEMGRFLKQFVVNVPKTSVVDAEFSASQPIPNYCTGMGLRMPIE
jgi:hypothetical protein